MATLTWLRTRNFISAKSPTRSGNIPRPRGEYDKVLTNYPKSFKLAPARLKKGMALIELGQKTAGVRELREVVKRYPGNRRRAPRARKAQGTRRGRCLPDRRC